MFRLADRFDGVRIRRARVHGGTDASWARQKLQSALADCTPDDLGLPPRALLILDRVAPAAPLRLVPVGGVEDFARSVREDIASQACRAVRPWWEPGAATAPAVLFADEVELVACLIRDWLRGGKSTPWWARLVLAGLSPVQWWRRELLPRGDLLPPVVAHLAAQGEALAWVARLDDRELTDATTTIALAHGYGAVPGLAAWSAEPSPTAAGAPLAVSADRRLQAAAARRLARLVPEVGAVAGALPRIRFLGIALGLQRDPAWVRGVGLDMALRALEMAVPAPSIPLAARPGSATSGGAAPSARTTAVCGSDAFPAAGSDVGRRQGRQSPGADSDPGLDAVRPDGPRPAKPMAAASGASGATPRVGPVMPAGVKHPPVVLGAVVSALGREDGDRHPGAAATGADSTADDETLSLLTRDDPARRGPDLSPPAGAAIGPAPATETVKTAYGGLFYLLNLALALGLYGDFTQPLRPGIALSPWDWLALIGRDWFGRGLERDPLWGLLARLASRPPGRAPGTGFVPLRDWSMPGDWPRPWGAVDQLGVAVQAGRLRLCHPAGFLLADWPRVAGCPPLIQARRMCDDWPVLADPRLVRVAQGPRRGRQPGCHVDLDQVPAGGAHRQALTRWLGWLRPFLEARLALALGSDDPAGVATLVCRHQALVYCSATALDLHLSLEELPIELRIAGLDRDPGWIPAADRSVVFHFV